MLAKLTAALVAYGPLGILVLAFIDSAGIPVASGMDALVILVAAKAPSRALLAASMGVLGSLIGNVVLFVAHGPARAAS
jgi:membrane protein YqaA with SNARE-associated domain